MTGMDSGFGGMQGHFNPVFMQSGGVPTAVGGQEDSHQTVKRFHVDESG